MLKKWLMSGLLNKKGSAMMMVIIVIFILSTLGLAVLSLSVNNYRLSLTDKKTVLSFYMAESGLEQAYEIVLNNVKVAVIEANNEVNTKIKDFIAAERNRMITESGYDSIYIIGSDPAGPIDVEKLKEKLKTPTDPEYVVWLENFQNKYKEYLSSTLVDALDDPSNYKVIDESVSSDKPDISVVSTSPLFSGDSCLLKLTSTFDKEEYLEGKEITQKVEIDFEIKVPDEFPDTIQTSTNVSAEYNPIYDYVFVAAKQDVDIGYNQNILIEGNCYAHGLTDGGIRMNRSRNNVTVVGDVSTYNSLRLKKDPALAKDSSFKVNGNVYAKNILFDEQTNWNEILIEGDAYTTKNIEVHGKHNQIEILGNWYGTGESSKVIVSDEEDGTETYNACSIGATFSNATEEALDTEFKRKQFDEDFIQHYLRVYKSSTTGAVKIDDDIPDTIEVNTAAGGNIINNYQYDTTKYGIWSVTVVQPGSDGEVYIINNSNRYVWFMAKDDMGIIFNPPQNSIVVDTTNFSSTTSNYIKGIVLSTYYLKFSGRLNFSGVAVSLNKDVLIYSANKNFKADPDFLKAKSAELGSASPFFYNPPASSPYEWSASTGHLGTTGDIGLGDSINMDFYKDLITVRDWKKI